MTKLTVRELSWASRGNLLNTSILIPRVARMPELTCGDMAGLIVGAPLMNARLVTVKEDHKKDLDGNVMEWDYHMYIVDRGVKHHILNLDVHDNMMLLHPMNIGMDRLLTYKNGDQVRHADYDESEQAMDYSTDEVEGDQYIQ